MSCMRERQNHKGSRQHGNGNEHSHGAHMLSPDNPCSGKEMASPVLPGGSQSETFWVHQRHVACFTWQKADIMNIFGCEETD